MAVGEALERTLLTMTAAHVAHSYLNQPIEVPALRPKLAALLGTMERPQILIRAGHGPALEPSLRRPVSAVLV